MLVLTCFALIAAVKAQNGSEYLENAIQSLRNSIQTVEGQRKIDEVPKHEVLPTLSLAKNELADYYETALKKGNTVKIGTPTGDLNAAVYELDEDGERFRPNLEDPSGYYYYYYPLKAFMNELSSGNHNKEETVKHKDHDRDVSSDMYHQEVAHTDTTHHQYHTHTHQHNIHIIEKPPPEEKTKKKALEPLFMAISGFVGMSVMFVLSMLILPKLAQPKPATVKGTEEGGTLAKVIYQAIEGYDCSERLSCEFGKTTRAFNVHNNRLFKLLRRIGPRTLSKQLYNINKYSNKKHKCAQIQCKPVKETPSKAKS